MKYLGYILTGSGFVFMLTGMAIRLHPYLFRHAHDIFEKYFPHLEEGVGAGNFMHFANTLFVAGIAAFVAHIASRK